MSTQDSEPKCWIGSLHDGPFHMCVWIEKHSIETRSGKISTSVSEHWQLLCESCAKNVGAWKLPEKKEEETSERQQSAK